LVRNLPFDTRLERRNACDPLDAFASEESGTLGQVDRPANLEDASSPLDPLYIESSRYIDLGMCDLDLAATDCGDFARPDELAVIDRCVCFEEDGACPEARLAAHGEVDVSTCAARRASVTNVDIDRGTRVFGQQRKLLDAGDTSRAPQIDPRPFR